MEHFFHSLICYFILFLMHFHAAEPYVDPSQSELAVRTMLIFTLGNKTVHNFLCVGDCQPPRKEMIRHLTAMSMTGHGKPIVHFSFFGKKSLVFLEPISN